MADLNARVEQMQAIYEMQGLDLEDEETLRHVERQLLESMINETLLLRGAAEEGISASESEIQAEHEEILARFEDEDALKEVLALQNLTMDDLKEDISQQITIDHYIDWYIEKNVDEEELEVTEDEVRALYERYSAQMEEGAMPDFEEVRVVLEEEISRQKTAQVVGRLLEELRGKSEIEVFL